MNNPRRIQRHLVKALAAGALLAAAALPMAIATAAGAATSSGTVTFTPALTYTGATQTGTLAYADAAIGAGDTFTLSTTAPGLTFSTEADTVAGHVTADYSATASLVPGTYSITVNDTTATDTSTATFTVGGSGSIDFNTSGSGGTTDSSYFGSGASGTFSLTDPSFPFAGDGGNTTVTTTAPGVTFSSLVNTTGDTITGNFASTSATVPGTYSVTVKDNAGTETYSNDFTVYGDPAATSVVNTATNTSSASDTVGGSSVNLTIDGGDFVGTPTVVLTSTVDGTSIAATVTATSGTETAPVTTLAANVDLLNSNNGNPATPGTYTVTITNPDGGSSTSGALFTVIGNSITAISPSALAVPATGTTTSTLTISGAGFESGATVTYTCGGGLTLAPVANTTTVTSGNSITTQVAIPSGTSDQQCSVTVTNNGNGGNGASYVLTDGLGIGMTSDTAPVITASSLSTATPILAGAPSTTITFTGAGFSSFTVAGATSAAGTNNASDPDAVIATAANSCIVNSSGTSLTCPIVINSGATAGAHTASLVNGSKSGYLPSAFSVDGPSVVSSAPASIAVGTPIGTVIALTGTGFNNTSGLTSAGITGTTGLEGVLQYSSATTENLVVTTSPTAVGNATFSLQTVDSYGKDEVSAPFTLAVAGAPSVSSITYATGTTGVGVGAKAQTIIINGSNFASGATVTAFTNAAGTADAAVTATVTSVNSLGTQITATVAIASPDTNTIDGFTVTNPDGGVAKALAVAPAGLVIDAGPTITSLSPVTATASSTNAFTITGTGFVTGATVTLSSDGTCGAATVVSATSITVSCTVGAAGSAAVTLSVVNPDGGTATSGTILAAKTGAAASGFHVTGAHGTAIAGRTVTMTISGSGFYGQPKITSTAAGTRVGVSKDSGKVLTIRVTTKKGIAGEHTFTIKLANGKSAKANYAIKK